MVSTAELKAKSLLPLEADCQHSVLGPLQMSACSNLQLLTQNIINNLAKKSN